MIFHKPLPISGDVASIPKGNEKVVRRTPQDVDYLKGGSLLAFNAKRVQGIDQRDG